MHTNGGVRMIKNIKIGQAFIALALTSTLTLSMTGCNKQVLDFNKAFNVAVEPNGDSISVVGIVNYNDYNGTQVQFETADGLRILSSTHQLQLVKAHTEEALEAYILSLKDEDDQIIYYSDDIEYEGVFNKRLIDLAYTFNKAIILKDELALIVELDTWRDYEEDDKIQIRLPDGTCILTEIDKVKLINDSIAEEGAIERYAATLVGTIDHVKHYGAKEK